MLPSCPHFEQPAAAARHAATGTHTSVLVLAWLMFLLPALGVPSELMLQDTLKSAVAAFGILIAACVFFWQQRQRTEPLLWHGLVWLPLALMAYALGSMLWSHTYLAGVEAIRWFLLSLLLWLGLNTLTRKNLPTLVWGVHAGAVAASVWAALQFWFDFGLFPQGPQPASTFVNRNFFAEYVVMALPYSVWALANARPSRWLGFIALSLALNVVAILMTGNRSALIALIVMLPALLVLLWRYRLAFAFSHWPRSSQILVASVVLAGVAVLGSIPSGNSQVKAEGLGTTAIQRSLSRGSSIAQSAEYSTGSFSVRSTMWKATARMALANAWTGVGAGAWEVEIPLYQRTDTQLETDYYAHNEFLQLLSEYGVVGGVTLAGLLAYLLKATGTACAKGGKIRSLDPARIFALASVLVFLIVSNAGFPLHLAGCGVLLSIGLAVLAGADRARLTPSPLQYLLTPLARHALHAAIPITVLCLLLAGYITRQATLAEGHIVAAAQLAAQASKAAAAGRSTPETDHARMLEFTRQGISINPHYRRLTALVAEPLVAAGDCRDANWVLASVTASRPNVVALWVALATCYAHVGENAKALDAVRQVQRIRPNAMASQTLKVSILSQTGHYKEAATLTSTLFSEGRYDLDLTELGYGLGYKIEDWALAIQALELRKVTWPEQAPDTHMRLGKIYADKLADGPRALIEFKAGLAAVPTDQRTNYRNQVPKPYNENL